MYILDGLWYKENWSLNKVTLEHMYLSEFILSFDVNFPDSEVNYTVKSEAKSMLAGHYRFVLSLTAYKCNWEHFVVLPKFLFFICIFAINAIRLKHNFTKFNVSTQF